MSNGTIYAMGIDPGGTSAAAVIGVPERSIYRDAPARISFFDTWSFTGNYTNQVMSLMGIAASFYPLVIILESFDPRKPIRTEEYMSPLLVGARIQMCVDTHYTLAPLLYQTPELAMSTATDYRLRQWGLYTPGPDHIKDATRHAITFIRRAKSDSALRAQAWGPDDYQRQRAHKARRANATHKRRLHVRNLPRQRDQEQ